MLRMTVVAKTEGRTSMTFPLARGLCQLTIIAVAVQTGQMRADAAPPLKSAAAQSAAAPGTAPQNSPSTPLDTTGLQSQALLAAIDKILKRTASEREAAKTLPGRDKFLFPPIWT